MIQELKIGICGAGEFANFAAKSFLKLNGITIFAVTDINKIAATSMATQFNAKVFSTYDEMLTDKEIDLIYIATPPFLHYIQSKAALHAGKHVICEKPAALKTVEAEELAIFSKQNSLLYVVILMQRYKPLYSIVDEIVKENMLGEFLHGFFENYASDEALHEKHWFWDNEKSGGIFIEHGVHFFDMFSGWLGEGELINAIQLSRPNSSEKIIDRVQATVNYKGGFVNLYHGFNQPKILDRQELRLQFEKGDITLYEWIPVKMKINALLSNIQIDELKNILGNATFIKNQHQGNKKGRGNFKDIVYDEFVTIEFGDISEKMIRYEELLIAMITDQWAWIKDKNHRRVIDENNAVTSLRIAEKATITASPIS
ncbi:MAG: Gfo/Idh/MocA family oxidoreductase [Ferruginibacter sp.]